MKKISVAIFVLLNAAFSASAIAAQGQALIQQPPEKLSAHDVLEPKTPLQQSANAVMNLKLPLDHGPRAEVTPWINQQRRLRATQEVQAALATQESK